MPTTTLSTEFDWETHQVAAPRSLEAVDESAIAEELFNRINVEEDIEALRRKHAEWWYNYTDGYYRDRTDGISSFNIINNALAYHPDRTTGDLLLAIRSSGVVEMHREPERALRHFNLAIEIAEGTMPIPFASIGKSLLNRALLKSNTFNDVNGGLQDIDRAIFAFQSANENIGKGYYVKLAILSAYREGDEGKLDCIRIIDSPEGRESLSADELESFERILDSYKTELANEQVSNATKVVKLRQRFNEIIVNWTGTEEFPPDVQHEVASILEALESIDAASEQTKRYNTLGVFFMENKMYSQAVACFGKSVAIAGKIAENRADSLVVSLSNYYAASFYYGDIDETFSKIDEVTSLKGAQSKVLASATARRAYCLSELGFPRSEVVDQLRKASVYIQNEEASDEAVGVVNKLKQRHSFKHEGDSSDVPIDELELEKVNAIWSRQLGEYLPPFFVLLRGHWDKLTRHGFDELEKNEDFHKHLAHLKKRFQEIKNEKFESDFNSLLLDLQTLLTSSSTTLSFLFGISEGFVSNQNIHSSARRRALSAVFLMLEKYNQLKLDKTRQVWQRRLMERPSKLDLTLTEDQSYGLELLRVDGCNLDGNEVEIVKMAKGWPSKQTLSLLSQWSSRAKGVVNQWLDGSISNVKALEYAERFQRVGVGAIEILDQRFEVDQSNSDYLTCRSEFQQALAGICVFFAAYSYVTLDVEGMSTTDQRQNCMERARANHAAMHSPSPPNGP